VAHVSQDSRLEAIANKREFNEAFRKFTFRLQLGEDTEDHNYHLFLKVEKSEGVPIIASVPFAIH
jgi:hypothetical protein